jgi:prepilin-type processing-associated H-X9-DG protein
MNYGISQLIAGNADASGNASVKQTAISAPALTYLCFDAGLIFMHPDYAANPNPGYLYIPGTTDAGGQEPPAPGTAAAIPVIGAWYEVDSDMARDWRSGRHLGGINIAFADGHVKWLKSSVPIEEGKKYGRREPNAWEPGKPPQ